MKPGSVVHVCETFCSIQGESTLAGETCFFIRLSGCNLRCRYCDAPRSLQAGRPVAIASLVRAARRSGMRMVEITGGEPLLQSGFPALARALRDATSGPVAVETNGSVDLGRVPEGVRAIVDVKSPGSGAFGSFDLGNLGRLRPGDEVKFVLCDRGDYEWARGFVERHALMECGRAVLFSPAAGRLAAGRLARWILEDRLKVRIQVPLHRALRLP